MLNEAVHQGLKEIIPDYTPAGEEALARYAVDDVIPQGIVFPDSITSLVAVVRLASAHGLGIIPRGGGTRMDIGMPPTRAELIVQLDKMNQVIEHEPADQTITVQAGIRLSELQVYLKSHGQYWAIDPPHGEKSTLGGIMAANASGPLRMTFGTARDTVIGLRVVQADGTIVKSGGKVVKNVAGYDLNKMYIGSLGTLGILAEITLKLQPIQEARHLVIGRFPSITTVMDAAFKLLAAKVMPTFIEVANPVLAGILAPQAGGGADDVGFPLIAGFLGQQETVIWQIDACEKLFQEAGAVHISHLEGDQYQRASNLLQSFPTGLAVPEGMLPGVTCRASVLPADIGGLYQLAEDCCQKSALGCGLIAHFSNGHISFVFYQDTPFEAAHLDTLAGIIGELQQAATACGGVLVVEHAPVALKSRVAVWGPDRGDLPIMRLLKKQFDPDGILNAGRFIGGI